MKQIHVVGISLIGSAIINLGGVWYQFRVVKPKTDKEHEREQNIFEWYLDTVSIARNLRRESIRLRPGHEIDSMKMEPIEEDAPLTLEEINICVKNLCGQRDEAPSSIPDEVTNIIDEIDYWFNNPEPKETPIKSHDIQEKISSEAEKLIDELSKNHEEIEAGSY